MEAEKQTVKWQVTAYPRRPTHKLSVQNALHTTEFPNKEMLLVSDTSEYRGQGGAGG